MVYDNRYSIVISGVFHETAKRLFWPKSNGNSNSDFIFVALKYNFSFEFLLHQQIETLSVCVVVSEDEKNMSE